VKVSFRPAAAFRCWIAPPRINEPLPLKPLQRRVHARNANFAATARFNLPGYGNAIGVLPYPQQGEQHRQFELAKVFSSPHFINYSEEIATWQLTGRFFCGISADWDKKPAVAGV
jgi:hypothetical protein